MVAYRQLCAFGHQIRKQWWPIGSYAPLATNKYENNGGLSAAMRLWPPINTGLHLRRSSRLKFVEIY